MFLKLNYSSTIWFFELFVWRLTEVNNLAAPSSDLAEHMHVLKDDVLAGGL